MNQTTPPPPIPKNKPNNYIKIKNDDDDDDADARNGVFYNGFGFKTFQNAARVLSKSKSLLEIVDISFLFPLLFFVPCPYGFEHPPGSP